jgi:hypothetical protein
MLYYKFLFVGQSGYHPSDFLFAENFHLLTTLKENPILHKHSEKNHFPQGPVAKSGSPEN